MHWKVPAGRIPRINYISDHYVSLEKLLIVFAALQTILVWYKEGMSNPGGPVGRENCGNCWISKNRSLVSTLCESTARAIRLE